MGAPKARKNTDVGAGAMATTSVFSVTTAQAGAVDIALPAGGAAPVGGIVVNSSFAGSVKSIGTTGAPIPIVPSTGLGAVDANSAAATSAGGYMVTTSGAGSVSIGGHVRNVDTSGAGSVKIGVAAALLAMPATGAEGEGTTGATVAGAGGNGQEVARVSWKMAAAAALDLFDLAHGNKLRAFLAVIAGAAEMHARGAIGRRILYASLAILLISIAVHALGWILNN